MKVEERLAVGDEAKEGRFDVLGKKEKRKMGKENDHSVS